MNGNNMATIKRKSSELGFAYLAVLFALALIGFGLSVTGQMWSESIRKEKEEDLLAKGTEIMNAINSYKKQRGKFPKNLKVLLGETSGGGLKRYLRKIYKDPMTNKSDWTVIKEIGGNVVGVSSTSSEVPFKTVGFSKELQHLEGKNRYSEWVFKGEVLPSGKVQNKSIK